MGKKEGRPWSKGLSYVLSAGMIAGLLGSGNVAAMAAEPLEATTVTTTVASPGDNMNLTAEGSIDWLHLAGGGISARKNIEEPVIMYEALPGVHKINEAGDSALSYSWSDGSAIESAEYVTKAAVYGNQNPDQGVLEDGVGYSLSVDAADEDRVLSFAAGLWEASCDIEITADDSEVYTNSLSSHGAVITIYTVEIAAGDAVNATVRLTGTTNEWGNVTLGGVALKKAGEETSPEEPGEIEDPQEPVENDIEIMVDSGVVTSGSVMDLTAEGTKDWMFKDGEQDDRKQGGSGLEISYLKDSNYGTFYDSKMSLSWTDGSVKAENKGTTRGKVFFGRKFQTPQIPEDGEVGYKLHVKAADSAQLLSFVAGVWEGAASVTIKANGAVKYTENYSAVGAAVQKKFSVAVPAGADIEALVKLTAHSNLNDGNVTVCGIALSDTNMEDCARTFLANVIKNAKRIDFSGYRAEEVSALKEAIANAEAVYADAEATTEEINAAKDALRSAIDACLAAKLDGKFTYDTASGLVASFGWEGDLNAPIAYIDGSYRLRDRGDLMVSFGVRDIPGKISWYNAEGYLPAFVSEYSKDGLDVKVENFAVKHELDGNDYEVAYSRMTVTNTTDEKKALPVVSSTLTPINDAAENAVYAEAGETVVRDYAIYADRFDGDYDYPEDETLLTFGSLDENYDLMRDYWNNRLEPLAEITELPNKELINAYKAGFIYTLLIRDDVKNADGTVTKELHVGENGYDIMFDHDTIGIVAALLTIGDFTYAKEYLGTLPAKLQYDDAKWKYSWPFALYLDKTGDLDFIIQEYETIKANTHMVESDRDMSAGGIIKKTDAIDSHGYWLIDNWSALTGLTTYGYLCDKLYEATADEKYMAESKWADELYADLLASVEKTQKAMREKYDYPYLSIDMNLPTENSARGDVRDGNWASMFLFGRWAWDGYLYGADQEGSDMIALIDDTYAHGFDRRSTVSDSIYNFGGYPHGYYSSAYNAGYGSSALRGEAYRDAGIKAYEFMIDKSMSGPFGWWEGVNYPNSASPWDRDHAAGGGGSCQHMWGQSTATKVLFDSLIAEKSGDKIIIGRGIPAEWTTQGKVTEIKDVSVCGGKKTGYRLEGGEDKITISFTGDVLDVPYSAELIAIKDNIAEVLADGVRLVDGIDRAAGTVMVPQGTKTLVIELGDEKPVEEEPVGPDPSEPVEPGPTDPTDPEPTEPIEEPVDPEPTDPTDPEPTDPTDPEPTDPEPTDPEPTEPEQPQKPSNPIRKIVKAVVKVVVKVVTRIVKSIFKLFR
ncbi:FIVAR domain-containing protein [Butyrivibrio sp. MC2013]|uniref:FIVAR domain-containing protein n=1 Tax=Butyrivibrio sp. MC2013 TaxID=1280686 RepID=UPI000417C53D|nr:FIVAR domain-containing protein [Butyrivibrio sp. MC2013]